MSEVRNPFGQLISVGDIVGWGRRNGNYSSHQVGKVVDLLPYEVPQYDWVDSATEIYPGGVPKRVRVDKPPLIRYKIRAKWTSGSYSTKDGTYKSTTEANDVFVLDPATLDDATRKLVESF